MATAAKAIDIANRFVECAKRDSMEITPLHIQKLLYFAQGWHLALHRSPLFQEPVQAWQYGPVVTAVYHRLKPAGAGDLRAHVGDRVSPLSSEHSSFVEQIWRTYGHLNAGRLSDMTHQEAPWRDVRHGMGPEERSNQVISTEAIEKFFREQLSRSDRRLIEFGSSPSDLQRAVADADAGRLAPLDMLS